MTRQTFLHYCGYVLSFSSVLIKRSGLVAENRYPHGITRSLNKSRILNMRVNFNMNLFEFQTQCKFESAPQAADQRHFQPKQRTVLTLISLQGQRLCWLGLLPGPEGQRSAPLGPERLHWPDVCHLQRTQPHGFGLPYE